MYYLIKRLPFGETLKCNDTISKRRHLQESSEFPTINYILGSPSIYERSTISRIHIAIRTLFWDGLAPKFEISQNLGLKDFQPIKFVN